jgi:hypothetical protein
MIRYTADLTFTDIYGHVLCTFLNETTKAVSVKKALSNYNFRCKKKLGLIKASRVISNGVIYIDTVKYIVSNNNITRVHRNEPESVLMSFNSNTIEVDGKEYIYNKEDGVYWLNGVQYSDYIIK